MKTLKQTINALLDLDHSQADLAKVAKVSQMTISRWNLKDPKLVNVAALNRLTKFLDREAKK